MVRRLVALVRASQQVRGERPELEKGLFPIARHHPLTGLPGHLGDRHRVVRRLKVVPIVRHQAIKGLKVVRIARPGLEARDVRVADRRVVVVRLGRSMGDHKMEMGALVVAQVIAGLHPVDQ